MYIFILKRYIKNFMIKSSIIKRHNNNDMTIVR